MNDTEHIIDTALETYPLVDLPPDFVRQTIAQIRPTPRFHLTFMDYALPVFFSFFGAIILAVLFWMLNGLIATWSIELQARFSQLAQYTSFLPIYQLVLATATCLVLLASVILALSLWLEKPIRLQRKV